MKLLRTRFGTLYVFGAVFLAVSLALRIALCVLAFHDLDARPWSLIKAFGVGLLFDLVTYLTCVLPVTIFYLLAPDRLFRWRVHRWVALAAYFLGIFFILFDAASEWFFWDEFGCRYNFVAVDYLVYTRELLGNIKESYPVAPILAGLGGCALAIVFLTRRWFLQAFESTSTFRERLRPAAVLVAAPLLAAVLVGPSLAQVSKNWYTNELARNGLYSFASALRSNIIDYDQFYLTQDPARAFGHVRETLKADNVRFIGDDPLSLRREVTNPGPEKRANVVLVVVESLSAEYLGVFGNKEGVTPNLDKLAAESLLFRNLYATGTRTDRGLEAVTLSLPPTPGRSMVKRPENGHMFSVGPIFRSRGYETKFIYGGYAPFDNMDTFFSGNGFQVIDRGDFAAGEKTFGTVWGLCDEDLLRRVIKECDKSAAAGKPFFSIALTTSNHRPFTYPPKIDIPSGTNRRGGVKYTDFAIGEFLAQARERPWFDNTIVVIIADHCASSAGRTAVPVDHYHIPCFVYAPKLVKPAMVDRLASQMDLAPTLLGLLGWSYESRFFGGDILQGGPQRALVGNYEKVGLFERGELTLLLPGRKAHAFQVRENGLQTPCKTDPALVDETVGYYQAASYLLKNHLYREDAPAPVAKP